MPRYALVGVDFNALLSTKKYVKATFFKLDDDYQVDEIENNEEEEYETSLLEAQRRANTLVRECNYPLRASNEVAIEEEKQSKAHLHTTSARKSFRGKGSSATGKMMRPVKLEENSGWLDDDEDSFVPVSYDTAMEIKRLKLDTW